MLHDRVDNHHMAEFNANESEGTLDFLILSGFSDGPQSLREIQQRVQWAERLLYVAAIRKGKRGPGSLAEALQRLQREGCLKLEQLRAEVDEGFVYALTDAGEERLEQERARRRLMVSQFVEDSELDGSFGRFLDRGLLGPG